MGFPYVLAVHGLQYFPPFTFEIIVVAVLIILLACPLPLAEYYNFTPHEDAHLECQTLPLSKDEVDFGEPSVLTRTRSRRASLHDIVPQCDVHKVLKHTSSIIKSIESTLKIIDKTNNDIIVNNLDVSNKISETTFIRAFQLDDPEEYKHDSHVAGKGVVDLGETGTSPLSDVDASVDTYFPDGLDVDSEDSNVSNDSDLSVASDEHGSVVSDSDEEQESVTDDGVSGPVSSDSKEPIALRRTDEITHLSGILVVSPNETNDESTTTKTNKGVSLTDLIREAKLDLTMIRDIANSFKQYGNGGQDAENVSSESDSNDDDLFLERREQLDDKESDLGLLDKLLNSPCNSERPHRSLDSLQEGVDYQDLENISNEDLENNKQFFVDRFINDEEIKNHSRFTRSKRKIFIEEIPISNEKEDHESVGTLDTLIESDLEAEDKYINPRFIMNDFSSDSDLQIRGAGNAVLEEGNIPGLFVLGTGRAGLCEYDALSKISEENIETSKEPSRYKSFSTFSDFKTESSVFDQLHANSEAIIGDDMFLNRYNETILNYTVNADETSTRSNPFLNAISGHMHDLYLNKHVKGEDSDILDSENMEKLHNTFKQSSSICVADVSTPIHIPTLKTQQAHTQLPVKDVNLENDVNNATRNKEIDLSQMPSRCRLIFGDHARPHPSDEDVLPNTDSQHTSTSSGISDNNSCWKFREEVRSKKIVFDKDTFLRRKEGSLHFFNTNSGSMNNLFEISNPSFISSNNNMFDVASTSYAKSCKEEEYDCENGPTTSAETTKHRTSRTSLTKFKLLFKTKSREKSGSDSSQKLSGNDLTERLSLSKSKSKRSRVFKNENGHSSKEDQKCSVEEDGSCAGTSETPDEEFDDILDGNTFTKLFHKITRKLKGNNSKAATKTTRRTNEKDMTVQNKLYVFKGNQGVTAFPTEDPLVVDRNVRSLDYFYSELQSDHHSLKITAKKMNIPASGSSTDTNTDLHLAPLMEDLGE